MRHVLLLALGIVLSKSHATAQAVDGCALSPEQLASIDTARQARADALVRGDPVAAADVAPDDGVILPAGGPVQQGRAALLAFFRTRTRPGLLKTVEIKPAEVHGCGPYAYDWGHFRWESADGSRDSTKYLWVWRREKAGTWRLAVAMWNQDR